ncbi:hypothetical protein AB9E14_36935, partial [Rhizobium leguminosarum]
MQNTKRTDKQQPETLISPHEIFFASVMSLDEDINQLRKQLAEKLHWQNVQLKRMLERFDGSLQSAKHLKYGTLMKTQ